MSLSERPFMEQLFRTQFGRRSLILGGANLAVLGIASLAEDPELTLGLVALIPMLSVAASIYIVVGAIDEVGGLTPISLASMMMFLGGVFVFGLTNATGAGPASGAVLIVVGALFALLGVRPERRALTRSIESHA
jgi:hypothetical protein